MNVPEDPAVQAPVTGSAPGGELAALLEGLARPSAVPFPVARVEVRQTHISAAFLAGDVVYKIRKPVRLPFLDFSTLALRRQDCEREVQLNRRLAPRTYLGVVPITLLAGRLVFEGIGPPVEWAVKMQRLPDEAALLSRLRRNELQPADLERLAVRLVQFHREHRRDRNCAAHGEYDVIARQVRENFGGSAEQQGLTISPTVAARLHSLTESALARLQPLISTRAAQGCVCDTHGDLRLDHVYFFPDRSPPDDFAIIDCIEFNDAFRYTDPLADMAFLVMDLLYEGRRDLAETFADSYFKGSGDAAGAELLPLYVSYRAAVRGKVEGLKQYESEVPPQERERACQIARGHWLLALNALERPEERVGLVLVGGLPGSGKSTLARGLAASGQTQFIRSDIVRKELAGLPPTSAAPHELNSGIYTPEHTVRTYETCLERAAEGLFQGQRVFVDATFSTAWSRQKFFALGRQWGVPVLFLLCVASSEVIKARLAGRRGDASDADWAVYQQAAQIWEPLAGEVVRCTRIIPADGSVEDVLRASRDALDAEGL